MVTSGAQPDAIDAIARDLLARARAAAEAQRVVPISTYRLQLHKDFTFRDAIAIVPYLADLGVTHVYASPYLKSRPGSTHGYDVVDHRALDPEIGTEGDRRAFVETLRRHGMGHVLDIVPNHVGVATDENLWWNDVLENGPASKFAGCFDIAWRSSPRPELQDKVLVPALGSPYADVLERGQLQVKLDRATGSFWVHYFDRRFPISPRTYDRVLGLRDREFARQFADDDPAGMEYLSIRSAARRLPDRSNRAPESVEERHREKEVIKRRLAVLIANEEAIADFVDHTLAILNGRAGDPASFDLLDDLLSHQCYRLAYWHVASDEINYRRFFDINDLAALAMHRREVFEATHERVLSWAAAGELQGLRVDHPDGLRDPREYFRRLQDHYLLAVARRIWDEQDRTACEWDAIHERFLELIAAEDSPPRLYVVVEKILAAGERLPRDWPVAGTTGYDALNQINGLFIDGELLDELQQTYEAFVGEPRSFDDIVYHAKRQIAFTSLASELRMLAHRLDRIAQRSRRGRDFTGEQLRVALAEVIACFGVYRTYVTERGFVEEDVRQTSDAIVRAKKRNPQIDAATFDFIADVLLSRGDEPDAADRRRWAGRFQQLTAPVTAKGVEDTAFYRYHRLISANEVGGEPGRPDVSPRDLHAYLAERQRSWPTAMTALSTHDTKRGEDVRARINVLSEIPGLWRERVFAWREMNAGFAGIVSADDQYLFYQTLLGSWPASADRLSAFMVKAAREAKVRTSWTTINGEYESSLDAFVRGVLGQPRDGDFFRDFLAFHAPVAAAGAVNSLAQTLLKLTVPGVPDTYQGTEAADFGLVDPDNRRPVDYDARKRLLGTPRSDELGARKTRLTASTLRFRRGDPDLFLEGDYEPIDLSGEDGGSFFAFARRRGDRAAVTVVPRLGWWFSQRREEADAALHLPRGSWRDALGEREIDVTRLDLRELLSTLPAALLIV